QGQTHVDMLSDDAKYNYRELTLVIGSAGGEAMREIVGKAAIASKEKQSGAGVGFGLGTVEGRTDRTRQRGWLIDRGANRVVATYDRQTGVATGINEKPPYWATLGGGRPIRAMSSDAAPGVMRD